MEKVPNFLKIYFHFFENICYLYVMIICSSMDNALADSRVLVKFVNNEGENAGSPLEIPIDTTSTQLQVNTLIF